MKQLWRFPGIYLMTPLWTFKIILWPWQTYAVDLAASVPGSWGQAIRKSRSLFFNKSRDRFGQCLLIYGVCTPIIRDMTSGIARTHFFLNCYMFMLTCIMLTIQLNFKHVISYILLYKVNKVKKHSALTIATQLEFQPSHSQVMKLRYNV